MEKSTSVVGEISNCSRVEIEGSLEGNITAETVVIRANGRVKGSIQSKRAEIHGTIEGQVHVQDQLEIRSTGQVSGELAYGKLYVEAGGHLDGSIQSYSQLGDQTVPTEPSGPGIYVNGHQ